MRISVVTFIVLTLMAGAVEGQSSIPEAGLAAEGQARWSDALNIYREQAAEGPDAAVLWTRIADIEAKLGHLQQSLASLERAAAAAPQDAAVFARLSQGYAAQDQPVAALRAMEVALELNPTSDSYLRARATLATWAGKYEAAADSYRTLRQAHPNETELTLALARVYVWSGRTDAAVAAYRAYVRTPAALPEALIELARAESWRGNFAGAVQTLNEYEQQFGKTEAYSRERASVLSRGGRPRQALRELDALDAAAPGDVALNLSRTVALAAVRRHGAAVSTLEGAESLRPGHAGTRAAESLVRTLLGSTLGPSTTYYTDSDGLKTTKVTPRFDIGFRTDTRLHGGYEHIDLQARVGSGLEQMSGAATATVDHVWAGLSQRVGALTVGGSVGEARPERHRLRTYGAFVRFAPADSFTGFVERSSGYAAISPRMAGLGITRVGHRAQVDWTPGLRSRLVIEGSYEDLSDRNSRWEVFVAPTAAVARTQHLNLDLGLLLHQFGARQNLDNGYYDPRRYEYYSVVLSPYWKASENIGVGVSAGFGGQRDDVARSFRPGSNASVEATFGIYQQWLLKVHGSATNNQRLDSGAFRGTSGGVTLLRRF